MFIGTLMKTLNPRAKEWRPKSKPPRLQPHQFLPHLMLPPPPQPLAAVPPPPQLAAQVVVFTPTPPSHHYLQPYTYYHPNHHCFFTTYNVVHSGNHVFVYHSSPAADFFSTAVKPSYVDETEAIIFGGNTTNCDEKEVEGTPIGDRNPRCKGTFRELLPPRLKRDLTSTATPPPYQEYRRPKKSAMDEAKDSGDGGATVCRPTWLPSPPPSIGGDFSRSSHTTVMMKNIPNNLRRDFMLEFLDEVCKAYDLEYDFLYLPMDFSQKDNLGYAFVNLTSAAAANKFKRNLHNLKWQKVSSGGKLITSKKICEITWARIQGKQALIKRFQNSIFRCDNSEYLPVLLDPPRNGSGEKRAPPVVVGKIIH